MGAKAATEGRAGSTATATTSTALSDEAVSGLAVVLRIHARADPACLPPRSLPQTRHIIKDGRKEGRADGRMHPLYSVNFAQRRSPPTLSRNVEMSVGAPMR